MRMAKNSFVSSSIFALASASDIAGVSAPDSSAASSSEPSSDTAGVDAFDSSPSGLDRGRSCSLRRCGAGSDGTPEARSTLGFLLGGRLLLDVGGSTTISVLWSIENMFELVEGVRDIGGSRLLGSVPFLPENTLAGPKDIGVVLLIFPNC